MLSAGDLVLIIAIQWGFCKALILKGNWVQNVISTLRNVILTLRNKINDLQGDLCIRQVKFDK